MNGILIVALVAGVALLDLFRLRARNTTLSRAGFLVAALPRALMPVAAAAAVGAWSLINAFQAIAESGHGGLRTVAGGSVQSVLTLIAGVLSFLVTLVVGLVLAGRSREQASDQDRLAGAGRRVAAIVGVMTIAVALGSGWMAMYWTDKLGVGLLTPMTRNMSLPPAPPSYGLYASMSGQEAAMQSEWLITSRQIGLVLCGVTVGLCFLTSVLFSRVWFSNTAWNVARGCVVALVAGAVLYSVHLGSGARWLRALMAS